MLKIVSFLTLACDRCGATCDTPDETTRYFHNHDEIATAAIGDEWRHEGEDRWTCCDCQEDE